MSAAAAMPPRTGLSRQPAVHTPGHERRVP
jgi:hypothetical protein